jgi:hypothetical protein
MIWNPLFKPSERSVFFGADLIPWLVSNLSSSEYKREGILWQFS